MQRAVQLGAVTRQFLIGLTNIHVIAGADRDFHIGITEDCATL